MQLETQELLKTFKLGYHYRDEEVKFYKQRIEELIEALTSLRCAGGWVRDVIDMELLKEQDYYFPADFPEELHEPLS